jgi:Asp-tRNA(Asn)/Glu-tRNA(Gln) amidotransferase B subunit
MKLKDIDMKSDKYDLQRGKDMRLCMKMWDYEVLAQDIKLCEDYNEETVFVKVMQMTKGKLNPGQLRKVLESEQ